MTFHIGNLYFKHAVILTQKEGIFGDWLSVYNPKEQKEAAVVIMNSILNQTCVERVVYQKKKKKKKN